MVDGLEKALQLAVDWAVRLGEAFVDNIPNTAAWAEATSNASVMAGVAVDTLQAMQVAFAGTGVSNEELTTSLGRLSAKMLDAKEGGEESSKAFARMGVRVTDATGKLKSADQVMFELSDQIAKMEPGAERTALMIDIFGRSGARLLPALSQGSEGMHRLMAEARELGHVFTPEEIGRMEEFNHSLELMGEVGRSLARQLAQPLIDALAPIAENVLAWVRANRALINSKLKEFADAIIKAGTVLGKILIGIGKGLYFVVQNAKLWGIVAAAIGVAAIAINVLNVGLLQSLVNWALNTAAAIWYGYNVVAAGVKAAAAWLATVAPVALLAALLALVVIAAEDVWAFMNGYDSIIGTFGPKWTKFLDDFTRPRNDDNWLLGVLREGLRFITDIEGGILRLSKMLGQLIDTTFSNPTLRAIAHVAASTATGSATYGANSFKSPDQILAELGGAASPVASAQAAAATKNFVMAPSFRAQIEVHAAPGQDPKQVAGTINDYLEEFYQSKILQVHEAAGGRR
jgi:hypothetical protein